MILKWKLAPAIAAKQQVPFATAVELVGIDLNDKITTCRQTSNISRSLVGTKLVDHSDVDIAPPVGSNIFILDLMPGLNRLDKANCKARRDTVKLWNLVRLY